MTVGQPTKAKATCSLCGKPCTSELERNADGTYAHDDCLRATMTMTFPTGRVR